jgi:hypothetical protein
LDSVTRSDFFEAYCDAARQREVWNGIPQRLRVAPASVDRDRRAPDIIPLLWTGMALLAHIRSYL